MRTYTLVLIPLVAVVAWLMVWAYWPMPVNPDNEWWGDGGLNRPRTLWVPDTSYDLGESTRMRTRKLYRCTDGECVEFGTNQQEVWEYGADGKRKRRLTKEVQ